ncbi:bifunctional sugar-binding transcriptional regulator/dihydroxyacetone kinase subunit DhaK [Cohaesibacter sp. CAU 1516]|uniref:bifunctional sugar-binding transcriptional regulator/dihydroxyacetone kinase subunit DhaK n=1 Tax=Cohaesibacter sp. CAU 1516 TaxID=2576038 RepID=UPI0010FE2451|nr:bifunctional sugar-binding transcriptional regulator/dihydroxyacetone kinase subunit DhaK [Cohaesibacter sp. CAU 1516]TLP45914.1 bifunctional sugar-binding transcriptional regulator/dihydroxyacetone kinase subunit DhaK [Cohaesibacter sp. CAU 1516]
MAQKPTAQSARSERLASDDDTAMPLRFGRDPLLWASWLYYEEGMTQSDIARIIGVSRATVIAHLAEARTRGIVNISIETNRLRSLSVSKALKDHFGLKDCLVIPGEGGERSLIERLGAAGAQVLQTLLKSGDTIGVGWGRTVLAVAEALTTSSLQDMRVVQITGSTSAHVPYAPAACASKMASAINAECIPLSAPAIVSNPDLRSILTEEPLIREQLACLDALDRIIFGIASMRPNSTLHNSGFFHNDGAMSNAYATAVGAIAGRYIDDRGHPVHGPLDPLTVGITLSKLHAVKQRIAIAGGIDKVPAILATLRGGYANILITDVTTGMGILNAEGKSHLVQRMPHEPEETEVIQRTQVKKFLNAAEDMVDEALEGAVMEHAAFLEPAKQSNRALVARNGPRPGKVGLVIGGGAGHDPGFLGYVGPGLADAVAIGNIFASPPPAPILDCTRAVNRDAGVVHLFGNYSGDILNFEMAAEMAQAEGIEVRTVITTDDVASSHLDDREGRRGVAGNVFVFKVAGAACDQMMSLDRVEELARKANERTCTFGVALEPCSMPETRRPTFLLGETEMEVGVGVHGEPGIARQAVMTADDAADLMVDRILADMSLEKLDEVALLINSLGSTPLMELYIIGRRVRQRLNAKGVKIIRSWTGNYFTSLDMVGVSISMMHLDHELLTLLDHPCNSAFFRIGDH